MVNSLPVLERLMTAFGTRRRLYWGREPVAVAADRAMRQAAGHLWERRLSLAVGVLLVLVLLLPGSLAQAAEALLSQWLPWLRGTASGASHGDKVVHFGLFALWTWTLLLGWPEAPRSWLAAKVLAVALGTELLQLLVPGRAASLGDFGADAAGMALVLGGFALLRRRPAARQRNRAEG
jgi:hypothetical protein